MSSSGSTSKLGEKRPRSGRVVGGEQSSIPREATPPRRVSLPERHAMEELALGQYNRGRNLTADGSEAKRFDLTEEPDAEDLSWTAGYGAGTEVDKNQIRMD
ncbi:hypothetical protein CSUI_004626, partial [Cystoisospora suis]